MANFCSNKSKVVSTTIKDENGNMQVLEGILYEPKGTILFNFGSYENYIIEDAISWPSCKIRRFIFLKSKTKK